MDQEVAKELEDLKRQMSELTGVIESLKRQIAHSRKQEMERAMRTRNRYLQDYDHLPYPDDDDRR